MQTECVRCHKTMDTVQGYKFSPTEYVCMACYDEFKAERAAKAKQQHKNPLLDQYGAEQPAPAAAPAEPRPAAAPPQPAPRQTARPAPPQAPRSQMFAPKAPPGAGAAPVGAGEASVPKAAPSAEICDVCRKPISDFKVPLKDGKKVCMGCNDILGEVAKSLILNAKCPHCGKDIQLAGE